MVDVHNYTLFILSFLCSKNSFVSYVDIRGLDLSFNRGALFSGISFSICRGSGVNFINTGNINGASLFGVLANRCRPASNTTFLNGGIGLKCVRRRAYSRGGAICRRLVDIFSSLVGLRGRLSTVTSHLATRPLPRLVTGRSVLGRRFAKDNNLACGDLAHSYLVNVNFSRSSFSGPASGLSNNRHSGLVLSGLLLSGYSLLLLSRPAGRLSVGSIR